MDKLSVSLPLIPNKISQYQNLKFSLLPVHKRYLLSEWNVLSKKANKLMRVLQRKTNNCWLKNRNTHFFFLLKENRLVCVCTYRSNNLTLYDCVCLCIPPFYKGNKSQIFLILGLRPSARD